jgi:hypothetical protein
MRLTTLRRPLSLAALAGLVLVSRSASVNLSAGQTPAGADQLTVNFVAVTADGTPVTTLKPEQVTIRFNGKPRQVKSLELVQVVAPDAAPAAAAAEPLAPPFGTNAAATGGGSSGRIWMLAVDEESIRPGSDRGMKEALVKWIDTVPATDRIGLTTLARGTNRVDFSASRAALKEGIGKIGSRQTSAPPIGCRTRDALDELRGVIGGLSGADATPVIVFFSGVLAASENDRDCELTVTNFDRVAAAQAGTRVQLFVVLPEIVSDMSGIQNLAGVTSSPLLNMSSGADAVLARLLRETSAYYVATFDIEPAERTDKPMRLEVRSDAATIRAPKDAIAPKAAAAKPDPKNMVKETRVYRDLPLRVTANTIKGTDPVKMQVVVIVEPGEPGTKLSAVSLGLASADGKMLSWSMQPAKLEGAGPFTEAQLIPTGKYRLRAAAVDANGRAGTADTDVSVDIIPAGSMHISGLLLGVRTATGISPRLVFKDDAEALVYFEIYGSTTKPIEVKVEIAKTLTGEAIAKADQPQVGRGAPGSFTVAALIPIATLPPGDYVARATFTIEGETPGIATRTLRKIK